MSDIRLREPARIFLRGTLDMTHTADISTQLQKMVTQLHNQGEKEITLDFSEVTRVDSSALALLTVCLSRARKNNYTLRLSALPDALRDLAKLCNMEDFLQSNQRNTNAT